MSVKKIIQESVNKNPLGVKEALEEALQDRVRAALEEKYAEMMESKDEDDKDMYESLDLSENTMHVDIDHMGGHDAMAKKHDISLSTHKHGTYAVGKKKNLQKYLTHHYDGDHSEAKSQHPEVYKESLDLTDYTVEELEDFMMSEDFDQLDEISKKTLGNYVKAAQIDAVGKVG